MKNALVLCVCLLVLIETPAYARASLKGSHASQERQNEEADRSGLVRVENDDMLTYFKEHGVLVRIPEVPGVQVDVRKDSEWKEKWAWVRPWTAEFLEDLGRDFYQKFSTTFTITSAVRTFEYQDSLRQHHGAHRPANGNAAPTNGSRRSSHFTGATIDITKWCINAQHCMTANQVHWIAIRLLALEEAGCIEATEEFHQTVFHVMVFRDYQECVAHARVLWETNH